MKSDKEWGEDEEGDEDEDDRKSKAVKSIFKVTT